MGLESTLARKIRALRKQLKHLESLQEGFHNLKAELEAGVTGPPSREIAYPRKRKKGKRPLGPRAMDIMKLLPTRDIDAVRAEEIAEVTRRDSDTTQRLLLTRTRSTLYKLVKQGLIQKTEKHGHPAFWMPMPDKASVRA